MEKFVTINQAAEKLGLTHWTVRGWIRRGLDVRRIGKRIWLRMSDVNMFIERENFMNAV